MNKDILDKMAALNYTEDVTTKINKSKFKVCIVDPISMKAVSKDNLHKVKFYIDSEGYLKALVHFYDNTTRDLIIQYVRE